MSEIISRLTTRGALLGITLSLIMPIASQESSHAYYTFTNHTFTNCGQTGRTGPSQASCRSQYSTTWDETDAYYIVSSGIQLWTVPWTGNYRIEAWGAAGSGGNGGGAGGSGAKVQGDFTLTQGTKIRILVGQMGATSNPNVSDGASGSGGGGTFVISGASGTDDSQVLLIAAGGGGSNDPRFQGFTSNGIGGLGSSSGTGTADNSGGSYRGTSTGASLNGASFSNGGQGGTYSRSGSIGLGGFGGGGATDDAKTGGGGWIGGTSDVAAYSKNNGSNQVNQDSIWSDHGKATITSLGPAVDSFSPPSTLTNSASFIYTLSFTQSVTGLATADFSVSGTGSSTCSIGSPSGSGATYQIQLTGCSPGTVILTLAQNSVTNSSSQTGPSSSSNASTVTIDQTAPTITSLSAPSSTIYGPGTQLNFTVNFSESVTVTGTPRLPLTVGSTQRYANFVSLTDSRTATFRYTVQTSASDIDIDGVTLTSPAELNGGSIADLATNAISNLSFSSPSLSGVKVAQLAAAPTITGITPGETTLTVAFTPGADNGSTIINYQFSTNGGTNFTTFSPVDTTTPLVITGLTNNTTYSVKIRALTTLNGSSTPGDSSNTLSATTSARPVNTSPPSISGTVSVGQDLIAGTGTWTNSPSSYSQQWVRSQSSAGPYSAIAGATANRYTIQSSDNSFFLRVVVQATNSQGSTFETSAATMRVKVPIAISGGSNISTTSGVVASSTAFTASGGYGAIGLTVTPVHPQISMSNGVVVAGSALPAGSYTETVTATDSLGDTATTTLSISVLNVVNAPSFTVGRGSGAGSFKIEFSPVTGVASYTVKVYKSNDSFANPFATIDNYVSGTDIQDGNPRTCGNASTPICYGIAVGHTFRFAVTPVAAAGYTSSGESTKSAKYAMFYPYGPTVTNPRDGVVGLDIRDAYSNLNIGKSGIVASIYRKTDDYTSVFETLSVIGIDWNRVALPSGETYSVTLRHLGATVGDTVWFDSDESPKTSGIFVWNKPDAPSNITAVRAGSQSIRVSWTRATGVYQAYYYYVSTNGLSWTYIGNTTSDSATITGLTNGTPYYIGVNNYGSGTYQRASDFVVMTGTITPATTPGPIATGSSSMSSNRINLSWTAPSINGGSAITGYLIEYSAGSTSYSETATTLASETSLALTGLTNGLTYYVRIKAVNSVGAGDAVDFGGGSGILVKGTAGSTVGAVTSITRTSATISATINARGNTTTPTLRWGLVDGTQTDVVLSSVTTDNVAVSSAITGLLPGRRYQVTSTTNPGISEDVGGRPIYFTTTPDSVTGVTAATTTSSITVSWTHDSGGNGYGFRYAAIAQLNGVQVGSGCPNITASSGGRSSCEFTGLTANTGYTFSITKTITGGDYGNGTSEAYVISASTDPNTATITLTVNGGNLTLQRGSAINIVATTNVAGQVTFRLNGRIIKNCKNKATSSLTATCVWLPSVHGTAQLSARFNPTSNLYTTVTSQAAAIQVVRRTGVRS